MRYLFLFIALFSITVSIAQNSYNIVELEPTKGKTRGSDFVGIDEDGFIYTTSIKSTWVVLATIVKPYLKVFNARTGEMHAERQLKSSKELKSIGMEYISLRFIDEKPHIICKKRKEKAPYSYFAAEINNLGMITGKPFKIGDIGDCRGFFNRGSSFSLGNYAHENEDGTYTFISDISCAGDDLEEYRVLELDKNMEVENSFKFKLEFDRTSNLSFIESEDHLYLKIDTEEKEDVKGKLFKKWITTRRLYKISKEDGALTELDVRDELEPLTIGDFRMNTSEEGIILSGQLIAEKGFVGLFTAVLDIKTDEVKNVETKDFDIDFVTKYWSDKEKEREERRRNRKGETEDDENFSTNFSLIETFNSEDGGLISVFQEYIVRVVRRTSTDANGVTTTDIDYYYYYKDVILVKTGSDGDIEYTKILPFYQLTVNYNPGKGYVALKDKDDLYFLHGSSNEMDEMIQEGSKSDKRSRLRDRSIKYASITHVDDSGEIDSEQVFDIREKDVSIDPSFVAVDEKNKQFVIVSPLMKMFSRKKTKVMRIEL